MKTNIPFIDKEGIHQIAPQNLLPVLKGFRIAAEVLPFKLFVFSFTAINESNGGDFTYETLINTIDKNLIIGWSSNQGIYNIYKLDGKKINGFQNNRSRVFFTAFPSDANFGIGPDFNCLVVQKSDIAENNVAFSTVDATGFAVNGVADNELGILILFDMNPSQINTTSQTL
jgi:hypothetical protein